MPDFNNSNVIDLDQLPELETEVGIAGSARRQEVGGPICVAIAAGIAIYSLGG